MIVITTPSIEGRRITACHGVVTGEATGQNGSMLMVSAAVAAVAIEQNS